MNTRGARGPTLAVICLIVSSPQAGAADSAYGWLMRISEATRELSYEGTFVYQHDDQLEAMRIIHYVRDGTVQERLVSLNGVAREVIRDDSQVTCYLPDRRSVVVEHRLSRQQSFPVILPERIKDLSQNYAMLLSVRGRVTGREAQAIVIKPRDEYRYGYHLWADRQTGLLLKANLVDHTGRALEQFMFTQLSIGGVIDPADLEPSTVAEGLAWYWGNAMDPGDAPSKPGWTVSRLPQGFVLANRFLRKNPARGRMVEHLVYSDGLATVSVFIDSVNGQGQTLMRGASRMGAVHAYGDVVNGHQVIVVGEVPAATVELIGKAVSPRR